jgi:SAM-dependent methyltransferase
MRNPACPICASRDTREVCELFDDRYGYPGRFPLRRCRDCGHRFLVQRFADAELNELYTRYYPRGAIDPRNYRPLALSPGLRAWFNGEVRAFALVPPGSRVLDIGCGSCETLGFHRNRGSEAWGVDPDANVRLIAEMHGFNVRIGVFGPGMFEAESFDWVTMDQVIEHLIDPLPTLTEIHRILKPGGRFAFTTPNASSLNAKVFGAKWINWHAPYHLQFFSPKSLRTLGAKTGFRLRNLKTHTSSEWLLYQQYHLATYPAEGEPSCFWAPDRVADLSRRDAPTFRRATWIHRHWLNHVVTRIEDALGVGDNFLGVLEKV